MHRSANVGMLIEDIKELIDNLSSCTCTRGGLHRSTSGKQVFRHLASREVLSLTLHSSKRRRCKAVADKTHVVSDVASRNAYCGQIFYSPQLTTDIGKPIG